MEKIVGFLICGAIIVGAQLLAVKAYEAWWNSETGATAPVPEGTVQFITFIVSLGVSAAILKVWPDDPA